MASVNSSKSINDHPDYFDAPVNEAVQTHTFPATGSKLSPDENARIAALCTCINKRVDDLRNIADSLEVLAAPGSSSLSLSERSLSLSEWELRSYRALFDSLAAGTISR